MTTTYVVEVKFTVKIFYSKYTFLYRLVKRINYLFIYNSLAIILKFSLSYEQVWRSYNYMEFFSKNLNICFIGFMACSFPKNVMLYSIFDNLQTKYKTYIFK